MAAPQQFSAGLYYVPRDGQPPNPVAEYLANYTATRLPGAQQVFSARLAQLDPSRRYAALAGLVDMRARLAERAAVRRQMAERIAADRDMSVSDALKEIIRASVDIRGQDTDMAVARIEAETEDRKARQISTAKGEEVVRAIHDAVNLAGRMADAGEDQAKIGGMLSDHLASAREAARYLEAGERAAIREEAQRLTVPTSDPDAAQRIAGTLGLFFQSPERIERGSYGPGAAPNFLELGQLAAQIASGSGAPPAAVTPSVPSGTGGSLQGGAPSQVTGRTTSTSVSRSAPAGGIDPEVAENIRIIDELMAGIRDGEADPFGQLGGFDQPLYGLGRDRPITAEGIRDLARRRPRKFRRIVDELGRGEPAPEPEPDLEAVQAELEAEPAAPEPEPEPEPQPTPKPKAKPKASTAEADSQQEAEATDLDRVLELLGPRAPAASSTPGAPPRVLNLAAPSPPPASDPTRLFSANPLDAFGADEVDTSEFDQLIDDLLEDDDEDEDEELRRLRNRQARYGYSGR